MMDPVPVIVTADSPPDPYEGRWQEHARRHEAEQAAVESRITQLEHSLTSRIDVLGTQIADLTGRVEAVAQHPTEAPHEAVEEAKDVVEVPAEVVTGEEAPEEPKRRRRRRRP